MVRRPHAEAERSCALGAGFCRYIADGRGGRKARSRRERKTLNVEAPVPWLRGAALKAEAPVASIAP